MSRMRNIPRTGWLSGLFIAAIAFTLGLTASGDGVDTATFQPAAAMAQIAPAGQLRSYADVADLAMPGVVNISTDKPVELPQNHPGMDDPFFRRFFNIPDNQQERVERSLGSGVIVSADGYILTSNHVIERGSKIRVLLNGTKEYEAEIVGGDELTDVALIKIESDEKLPFVQIGDSDVLRIGDQVMAIGNPFGVGQTATMGIVSAKGRNIGMMAYEDFIQTDASINPGNSGGALVNMSGQLVGINTAIMSRSGGSQGVGFSIPSNMASRIMGMLVEHGEVQRAWLGVVPVEVDQTMAEALGMDETRGVLMSEVRPDTPAEKAGLKEGDIVLEVDGNEVNSTSTLRNTISLAGVGTDVKLRVLRDGRGRDLTVTLGQLPDVPTVTGSRNEERQNEEGIDGVTVRNLSDTARTRLNIDEDVQGVIVTEVSRVSNAWNRGLRQGDVITEVAREEVEDLDDYEELVGRNPDRPVLLKILRGVNVQLLAIPR